MASIEELVQEAREAGAVLPADAVIALRRMAIPLGEGHDDAVRKAIADLSGGSVLVVDEPAEDESVDADVDDEPEAA